MVWRYACGVFIILKVFLITFSAFLALLYVELISQGESPASVREYVSTWVRQYVHKHEGGCQWQQPDLNQKEELFGEILL